MAKRKNVVKRETKKRGRPVVQDQGKVVDPVDVAGPAAPYIIFLEKKVEVLVNMYQELETVYSKIVAICERAGQAEEEIEDDPEIQQFLSDEELDDDPEYA